ncbi:MULTISPECIES: hypothetical protein [unclassified Frondihabitans]|uniref:hypothetical protein n=1 Tax=unclassified Frondihabitans TaxID=2626248 RepID=UPI000F4E0F7E|nr:MULTISPECIES: hypothetical protein [unclassified Frondihabitans]RPE77802.1 hypothetical protein EDF37_0462 [Frondihabitans sp. PhB153]RPF08081.1 hypothetical protein EDF39_0463 [Frondihabitans sp. PhB161]
MSDSTAEAEPKVIADIHEMLATLELVGIKFFEMSAKVDEDPIEGEPLPEASPSYSLKLMGDLDSLTVRLRAEMFTPEGRIVADAGAQYRSQVPYTAEESIRLEFANRVGIMALAPFLREAIATTSLRVLDKSYLLPLLRAGDLEFLAGPDDSTEG